MHNPNYPNTMKHFAALLALHLTSVSAIAGPLGVDMGQPLEVLGKQMQLKKEREFVYSTKSTPRPHPDFEAYNLVVTPEHGLCKVGAISKTFTTSVYGEGVKEKFDDLEATLSEKYGKGDRNDFLKSGSIWSDARDWMMALRRNERVLVTFWTSISDKPLPDNIVAIQLEAKALSTNSGWISLQYDFSNASDCIDSMKKKRGSTL